MTAHRSRPNFFFFFVVKTAVQFYLESVSDSSTGNKISRKKPKNNCVIIQSSGVVNLLFPPSENTHRRVDVPILFDLSRARASLMNHLSNNFPPESFRVTCSSAGALSHRISPNCAPESRSERRAETESSKLDNTVVEI